MCLSSPVLLAAKMWLCVVFFHTPFISSIHVHIFPSMCLFVLRTQEELRVREEDQQTITVEVELKRHDSEPTITAPQPPSEPRYIQLPADGMSVKQKHCTVITNNLTLCSNMSCSHKYYKHVMREINVFHEPSVSSKAVTKYRSQI